MEREWKDGDIVRWGYLEKILKARQHGNNGGTTYWCCSQIAIFKDGRFIDIYWHGSDNKKFSPADIGDTHEVNFVANFDELEHQTNDNKDAIDLLYLQYDSKDIVDLNHSNNTRGNLYLRKGAKKKIDIMRNAYINRIKELEYRIKSTEYDLEKTIEEYQNLTEENFEEHKIWLR